MTRRAPLRRPHRRRLTLGTITSLFVLGALFLPAPSVSAAATCQATFTGDATGAHDVTKRLTNFLDNHRGRRLCLRKGGIYRVDGTVRIIGELGLRLNGRHAVLRAGPNVSSSASRQQVRIESGRNVVIKNLKIRGRNPDISHWNASREHEHGIAIYGGHGITIKDVKVRDTYGDGIYLSYISGRIPPPSGITLRRVDIARAGRSGIAIVGGHNLLVAGAAISGTGLHAIDLEPDLQDADIHDVTVQGSSLRRYGRAGIYTGYALAIDGKAGEMRNITITNNRADRFNATVLNENGGLNRNIVFTGNRSNLAGRAYLENIRGLTFRGNVRITAVKVNVG